jgi:hypothetical protein
MYIEDKNERKIIHSGDLLLFKYVKANSKTL